MGWTKQKNIRLLLFSFSLINLAFWYFLFFHVVCKISNFDTWMAKHLAQASCTELTLLFLKSRLKLGRRQLAVDNMINCNKCISFANPKVNVYISRWVEKCSTKYSLNSFCANEFAQLSNWTYLVVNSLLDVRKQCPQHILNNYFKGQEISEAYIWPCSYILQKTNEIFAR